MRLDLFNIFVAIITIKTNKSKRLNTRNYENGLVKHE